MSGSGGMGTGSSRKKPRAIETTTTPQQWIYETIFEHCYPRIDMNVSTHMVREKEEASSHVCYYS